jgi:hypothetical protein
MPNQLSAILTLYSDLPIAHFYSVIREGCFECRRTDKIATPIHPPAMNQLVVGLHVMRMPPGICRMTVSAVAGSGALLVREVVHIRDAVSRLAVNVAESRTFLVTVNYKKLGVIRCFASSPFFQENPLLLFIRICGCVWNTINGKCKMLKFILNKCNVKI